MSPGEILFSYVTALLAAIALLAVWGELRRRRFGPASPEDHIFRCGKCGYVYTDDPDVDRSRCPQCGLTNDVYSF